MEINQSVNYMEKHGNLKGFSDDQKLEFSNLCNANFFFYDPYKDLFINPITSKKYSTKTLQRIFKYSKSSLEEKIRSKLPTKAQVDSSLEKLYSRKKRAYILWNLVISNLKYFGLIVGGMVSYILDFNLGLVIGSCLLYFDYNTFDKVNGLIKYIQGDLFTSLLWQKKRNMYFFFSFLLLTGLMTSLYMLTNSILVVIVIFLAQKFVLVNPTIQFITSSTYRGTEIAMKLEQEYEKQCKNSSENLVGIKKPNYIRKNDSLIEIKFKK